MDELVGDPPTPPAHEVLICVASNPLVGRFIHGGYLFGPTIGLEVGSLRVSSGSRRSIPSDVMMQKKAGWGRKLMLLFLGSMLMFFCRVGSKPR